VLPPSPTGTERPKPSPQKELKEIERDKASGVTIKVVGASLQKLVGYVKGMHGMRVTLHLLRSLCRQMIVCGTSPCCLLHIKQHATTPEQLTSCEVLQSPETIITNLLGFL